MTITVRKHGGRIEQLLRAALTGPERHNIKQAAGWDDSNISRLLSGQQGITIEKLEVVFECCGISLVTRKYLDAMATMCQVGANCECARNGQGECGRGA